MLFRRIVPLVIASRVHGESAELQSTCTAVVIAQVAHWCYLDSRCFVLSVVAWDLRSLNPVMVAQREFRNSVGQEKRGREDVGCVMRMSSCA